MAAVVKSNPPSVRKALILATVPVSVNVVAAPQTVTLFEAAIVASPDKLPLVTVKVATTSEAAESTSAMLIPVKSVVTPCVTLMLVGAAETVGASFTAVTVIATVSVSVNGVPVLSVETTVSVSAPL